MKRSQGFTLLEMLVTATVLVILAGAIVPMAKNGVRRQKELELRRDLREMRQAIDDYKIKADQQKIMAGPVENNGYPESLEVLVEEDLVKASAEQGLYFKALLEALPSRKIQEIRCLGLWAGVQLTPEAGPARAYCHALQERGLLCKDTHTHTIRLAPPLVITREQLDWSVAQLAAVLA